MPSRHGTALAWFLTLTGKHCPLWNGCPIFNGVFRPLLHLESHNALLARGDWGPAAADRPQWGSQCSAAAAGGIWYHITDRQLGWKRALSPYLHSFSPLWFTVYTQLQRTLVGEVQMMFFALFLWHWSFQLSLFKVIKQPLLKETSQSLPCQCYKCSEKLTLTVPVFGKVIWISDTFWYNHCVPAPDRGVMLHWLCYLCWTGPHDPWNSWCHLAHSCVSWGSWFLMHIVLLPSLRTRAGKPTPCPHRVLVHLIQRRSWV